MDIPGEHEGSQFIRHIPCDACGSKDNAALYDDGHTYCFGCEAFTSATDDVEIKTTRKLHSHLIQGEYSELSARGIREDTCRKFDYQVGDYMGRPVQIENYKNDIGEIVVQKTRDQDKNFTVLGDALHLCLFGEHLWESGKKLVVTEGPIDAMTVSQVQNNKWPVVSVPNGAQSAKKYLLKAWDFLEAFDEIILMFDDDEAGRKAAVESAEALPIGRVKIARIPNYKDANDALMDGAEKAIIDAIWSAKVWRPDGIVNFKDLSHIAIETDEESTLTYPYQKLNDITKGIRQSTLVTICAGSGVGKSTFVTELAYHLNQSNMNIGLLCLESENKKTVRELCGIHLNKNIVQDPTCATEDEIVAAHKELSNNGTIALFDHFGATNLDVIKSRIQYMVKAMGCTHIFLDHLSIIISSMTLNKGVDERRLTDSAVTDLRTLVQELKITLFMVSHLSRPQGEGHESGGKVKLNQLRSSHSIAQLSDFCIAMNVDPDTHDSRELVVLKNRFTGECGFAGKLNYLRDRGRLIDATPEKLLF